MHPAVSVDRRPVREDSRGMCQMAWRAGLRLEMLIRSPVKSCQAQTAQEPHAPLYAVVFPSLTLAQGVFLANRAAASAAQKRLRRRNLDKGKFSRCLACMNAWVVVPPLRLGNFPCSSNHAAFINEPHVRLNGMCAFRRASSQRVERNWSSLQITVCRCG